MRKISGAILVISGSHSTKLGPAVGGTRFLNYPNDDAALEDALRLSRGMTYKNALAGLPFGGGKSIIIGDNKTLERETIFRAHGRFVETLRGRYIAGEDVGTNTSDMEYVRNDQTIPQLNVEIVVGAANNQLLSLEHGDMLEERNILYAPDYVANAGGIINGCIELLGWEASHSFNKVHGIYDTLLTIFQVAKAEGIPTYRAADRLAESRLAAGRATISDDGNLTVNGKVHNS